MRILPIVFAGMALLPLIGLVVAVLMTDDGIDAFDADPVAHRVAEKAYFSAWAHHDNPIQRILAPAARVVLVEAAVGHCKTPRGWSGIVQVTDGRPGFPALAPGPDSPYEDVERDYVAQVRFYTFFGYPAADVYLTCGASSVSSTRPPTWN